MSISFTNSRLQDFGILFLISFVFLLPVLIIGPPSGSPDLPHHLTITAAWQSSIENGTIIPEWVDPQNNGYGGVNARYYPPILQITYAVFQIFVDNWTYSLFFTFLLWGFVGKLGVYLWVYDLTSSRSAALSSAFVFAFTPYHANQFYHSFMWAEFISISIVPFTLYLVRRQNIEPSLSNTIWFTVTIALLILSNIPQLIVAAVCVAIFFVATADKRTFVRSAGYAIAGCSIALTLTSFFWIRVAKEIGWLYIGQPNIDPLYDYRKNFLLGELNFLGDAAELTPLFGSLFLLFTVMPVLIAVVSSGTLRRYVSDRSFRAVAIVFAASAFLVTPFSKPIWDAISILQKIQFPWRFLSVASLFGAVMVGVALSTISRETWRTHRPAKLILLGSVLVVLTFTVKQDILASDFTSPAGYNSFADKTATMIGLEHWRPIWTTKKSFPNAEPVSTGNGRQISVQDWEGTTRSFTVSDGDATNARLALMHFPHWKATINAAPAEISEDAGAISISIPPGAASVQLTLVEPGYTVASRWVSLFAAVGFFTFMLLFYVGRRVRGAKFPVLSV